MLNVTTTRCSAMIHKRSFAGPVSSSNSLHLPRSSRYLGCAPLRRCPELIEEGSVPMGHLIGEDRTLLIRAVDEKAETLANTGADPCWIGFEPARDEATDVLPAEPTRFDLREEVVRTVGPARALIGPRFQHRESPHELRAEWSAGPEEEVVDVLGRTTEAPVAGQDLLADHLVRIEAMDERTL